MLSAIFSLLMKPTTETSKRASAFRFDATLEEWTGYQRGYADATLDASERRMSPIIADEEAQRTLDAASEAAKKRLDECARVLLEESDGENLSAPFCGCEVCVAREILDAAYNDLERHFAYVFSKRLGFEINWGDES